MILPGRRPTVVEVAVLVSGVSSMGIEILAGRLLAPAYGSSVFVWGSVIGVFLAALAAGYWVAGRRAAEHASAGALALALIGAGAVLAVVISTADGLITASQALPLPARFAPLVPATVLFGPPTLLLGFVSPYAAELIEARSTGDASGRVYAIGTGGSILGAFGTTFLLIPAFDVVWIGLAYALLTTLAGLGVAPRGALGPRVAAVGATLVIVVAALLAGVGGIAGGGTTIYETETAYQHLRVADSGDVRTLYLDGVRHSAMDRSNPDRYVFEYTRYFHLPWLFRDDIDRVLFVGGGGFSGPKRFLREYPGVEVDVVEIDPAVVDAARQYFDVPRTPRLDITVEDGRVFLANTSTTYDVVILDAYRADRVPYHLTTVEFMRLVRERLDDEGVLVANVISAREGGASAFYRAQYRTVDRVFPQVYSFPTTEMTGLQNIMLVATRNATRIDEATLSQRNERRHIGLDLGNAIRHYRAEVETGDAPLLTDDYAPVDSLLAEQLGERYVVQRTTNRTASPP
ncbi:MAG: spermidine synthase [Salinirussus sp.]